MKTIRNFFIVVICSVFIVSFGIVAAFFYQVHRQSWPAKHFGITVVKSTIDYDMDGLDDYTDILQGARKAVAGKPEYKSAYYEGGYPPEGEGVCTDVIWRALQNAGYSLKDLIDRDIEENVEEYPRVEGTPDSNIDFRRVDNIRVYLERHHTSLTKNINLIAEWQPGDIVVFGDSHIAIISDKRNKDGVPYIIHHDGRSVYEEDILRWYNRYAPISGHFRWNGNNA